MPFKAHNGHIIQGCEKDHDHGDNRSVTSTDFTESVSSSASRTFDDDEVSTFPQHRIFIFELALGEDDEDENDEERLQPRHRPGLYMMWRKCYITESCSILSDLTHESNDEEDYFVTHDDSSESSRHQQKPEKQIKQHRFHHQQHLRQHVPRFLPKMIHRSIERINSLRPLAGLSH
ncbi:hypothetical protein IV203_025824 [Nitzschia inconspicua]|uniref:Uncharacterized protein n=1 Tax=Nitzschia inconspicua TaxID=303405 RepID=A0A9K3K8I0_9STRA|nr:hypothetical protein IV203_017671 [Nitzschia inconspicua]KAG7362158.1 hypothetical protein IV203_025824 [Nitzschia inconspicua]